MIKLAAPLVLVLSFTAVGAVEQPAAVATDTDAVRQTVQYYFDGMMQANPAHLRRAFHAEARLMGIGDDGAVMIIPFDRWVASWEGRDPRDVTMYRNTIVSTDVTGIAATVKTDLEWPNVHYVDYLSLLRVGDQWKIVNKIWWEEPR